MTRRAPLDVERLAAALHEHYEEPAGQTCWHDHDARRVARIYERAEEYGYSACSCNPLVLTVEPGGAISRVAGGLLEEPIDTRPTGSGDDRPPKPPVKRCQKCSDPVLYPGKDWSEFCATHSREPDTDDPVARAVVTSIDSRSGDAANARAAPRAEGLRAIEWPDCTTHHGCRCREYAVEYVNRIAIDGILASRPPEEKSIEELAAEKGIGPIKSADDLRIDLTDEEADAFIEAMESEGAAPRAEGPLRSALERLLAVAMTEEEAARAEGRREAVREIRAETRNFPFISGLDVILDRVAALNASESPPTLCVECGEPWPCDATVRRTKDGIPHRLGDASESSPTDDYSERMVTVADLMAEGWKPDPEPEHDADEDKCWCNRSHHAGDASESPPTDEDDDAERTYTEDEYIDYGVVQYRRGKAQAEYEAAHPVGDASESGPTERRCFCGEPAEWPDGKCDKHHSRRGRGGCQRVSPAPGEPRR